MLFTYNTTASPSVPFSVVQLQEPVDHGIRQHRLLRDVPADGESFLSQRARIASPAAAPKGLPPLIPTDLLTFLKPHQAEE